MMNTEMTREEAVQELKKLNTPTDNLRDPETDHGTADDILCARLLDLGEVEVVEEYLKVEKWYS